jgi:putative ABC transport system permease protein
MRASFHSLLWSLLRTYSWQELRQHPWRNAAAVVAVMLGVALAFSVHLINASALDEFSSAVRSVGGQPDLQLRDSAPAGISEALYARLLRDADVSVASPVLELSTYARLSDTSPTPAPDSGDAPRQPSRLLLRVVGIDALLVAAVAPDLMPLPASGSDRLALFATDAVFLNATARSALLGTSVQLQKGLQMTTLQIAGDVRAGGAPLAVMDIAAMQDFFGKDGQLSRVDIRLKAGVDKQRFIQRLQAQADWPASAQISEPGDAVQRIDNLSRAYRVNLTVLALIALFTGGFLVFSVLSLSVARRTQQFALLGVMGMTGYERLWLVLVEAAVLGFAGSMAGLLLGTGLAATGLRVLGGDLGGGYFSGTAPALQWSPLAALVFATLGLACALAGAWWPARAAQHMPPAQALKGLGSAGTGGRSLLPGMSMLALGGVLALLPPIGSIALAAYLSVALILLGGIAVLPAFVGWVLDRVAPFVTRHALPLLAIERARRVRESASVAVSGVVAALSLAVALTVMVSSFRSSVTQWLDTVLPASLYLRTSGNASANDTAFFDPEFIKAATAIPGVERVSTQRSMSLTLDPARPALVLIAKPLREPRDPRVPLALVNDALPVPTGSVGIYVSEAVVDLYGIKPGQDFVQLRKALNGGSADAAEKAPFFVAGVWRDYARQFGSVAIDQADFARLSSDKRTNEIALWLNADADSRAVERALRALGGDLLEIASAREIRAVTLKIFDRSFAVTYWLQAVAIGIGLFGVAASFSAQVLARRKEFGLLQHLGLTRQQVLRLVAAEGAAWTLLGSLAGTVLGLCVAIVLVHVVNPQSFHWTMELSVPWLRLFVLALAVVAAGTITARLAGRAAAGRDAVMAVKEDW